MEQVNKTTGFVRKVVVDRAAAAAATGVAVLASTLAAHPDMLPAPWEARRSTTTGRAYFYNPATGVSQYAEPQQPVVGHDQRARHPASSTAV